jgi:hypothetical protein
MARQEDSDVERELRRRIAQIELEPREQRLDRVQRLLDRLGHLIPEAERESLLRHLSTYH